jgi:hypothetical protein
MAHRDDVADGRRLPGAVPRCWPALLLGVLAFALSACSGSAPSQGTINRGQVIDQDTGQPIPGVIVVGLYIGSVRGSGASSCNRVESTVSDENGWFELPLDPNAGPLKMAGYHRDYRHGYPMRVPTCLSGRPDQCQIWQDRRDDNDHVISVVKEPKIYPSEDEAAKAARYWDDLYLKRLDGTRDKRLYELWRLQSANSCLATPKTSQGLVPFLEAILQEELELGDSQSSIRDTKQQLAWAREALLRRK